MLVVESDTPSAESDVVSDFDCTVTSTVKHTQHTRARVFQGRAVQQPYISHRSPTALHFDQRNYLYKDLFEGWPVLRLLSPASCCKLDYSAICNNREHWADLLVHDMVNDLSWLFSFPRFLAGEELIEENAIRIHVGRL